MLDWKRLKDLAVRAAAVLLIGLASSASHALSPTVDEIIRRVERRYSASGFSARFFQTSTIKAMEISENAAGLLMVKKPDSMRWEYDSPERQLVISDGVRLWVYRPDDQQVMVGRAPSFFGDGKGAGFLSDIEQVRENFTITLDGMTEKSAYRLKLLPRKKTFDIAVVYLSVSPDTFDVVEIITYNEYADETRIRLSDIQHREDLDDSLFRFKIPEGTDIVKMDG